MRRAERRVSRPRRESASRSLAVRPSQGRPCASTSTLSCALSDQQYRIGADGGTATVDIQPSLASDASAIILDRYRGHSTTGFDGVAAENVGEKARIELQQLCGG